MSDSLTNEHMSDDEMDDIEEQQIARLERKKVEIPFLFSWCHKCTLLDGCYFQHGTRDINPSFLTPECGEGPAT